MRYFVTGGTGFIGTHLVRALLARGDRVVALVRDPTRAGKLQDWGAELAVGDITRPDTLVQPMTGVDGVFHVAGWYQLGAREPARGYAINVEGTRNVLQVMSDLAVPKGVYTSTLAANSDTGGIKMDESYRFQGNHLSAYDETKALAHHQVAEPMMAAGLPLVIVQPGVVYGPGDTSATGDSIRDFLRGDLPMVPRGTAVCWAHVADIIQGHLLAIDQGKVGESYIIAGPCHTFVEFIDILAELSELPAPAIQAPPWLLKAMSIPMNLIERAITLPAQYSSEGLRVIAGTTYLGDDSKARQQLGYEPRTVRQGLAQALPAYLKEITEN